MVSYALAKSRKMEHVITSFSMFLMGLLYMFTTVSEVEQFFRNPYCWELISSFLIKNLLNYLCKHFSKVFVNGLSIEIGR